MKKVLSVLILGVVLQSMLVDGRKRKRVFFREVQPTTASEALVRNERGVFSSGYEARIVEQHTAAIRTLEEATQNARATKILVDNLQRSLQLHQQLDQVHSPTSFSLPSFYPVNPQEQHYSSLLPLSNLNVNGQLVQATESRPSTGRIHLVNQYGNEVATHQGVQTSHPSSGYTYPVSPPQMHSHTLQQSQEHHQHQAPGPQNAYLPPVAPQPHQHYLPQPAPALQQHQLIQYQIPQAPQLIQYSQAQPLFQQIVTPEGYIYFQPVYSQQEQVVEAQPVPIYHQLPSQPIYHHDHTHLVSPIAPLPPAPVHVYETPVPIVKKVGEPVVTKTIIKEEILVPTVKLIKQPILPPSVFQKEIFAIKNPQIRVLTYSDLCTVYPYQSKLAGCVYKKASIPELHHPDIQLIPEQTKTTTQTQTSTTGEGILDPRTKSRSGLSTNINQKSKEGSRSNIQDILNVSRRQGLALSSAESNSDEMEDDSAIENNSDEHANIAESSNKKESLVIKTTKVKPKAPVTTEVPPTTTKRASTSSRKPKTKRRSSNRKGRNQRKSKKLSTTTEQPFKLA